MDPHPCIRLFGVSIPIPIQQPEMNPNSDNEQNEKPPSSNQESPIPIQQQKPPSFKQESPIPNSADEQKPPSFKQESLIPIEQHEEKPLMLKQEKPVVVIKRLVVKMKPKPQPSLPPQFRSVLVSVGASINQEPILIFNRTLFKSDVDRGLTRLAMPRTQIVNPFLTNEEETVLRQKDSQGKVMKISVSVIDPSRKVSVMNLSRWDYTKSTNWTYALSGGWNKVVKSNGFRQGDGIQVWAFRKMNGDLGFVIPLLYNGESKV